jgi:uncharacterized membrane protein YfcA
VLPELTAPHVATLLALGLAVGTIGSTVGIGGGILLVPVLLLLFPEAAPAVITSMSLTAVVLNALSATTGYRRLGWQDTRTGAVLVAAAVPAAIGGAFLTRNIERGSFEVVFGVALVVGGLYLAWRGRSLPAFATPSLRGVARRITDSRGETYVYRVREWLAAAIALVAGFIAAFFGIGGGIINVPVMMLVLKMPSRMAIATSQLELMIASAAALAVHLSITFGEWDPWIRGLILGAGTLTGAQIGVRAAGRASGRIVLLIIAVVLFLSGARQIIASA